MSLFVELNGISKAFQKRSSFTGDLANAMGNQEESVSPSAVNFAVNQVTLTLKEGERLGIVGRNGAGKSTLLHMIAGISQPTSGKIHINGKVTSIMTLGVGLRDDLSGRENIYVDGEIQGRSRSQVETIIDEVIDFAELGKFIDYPVRTYSTGMKARLAFSMIAHISPEILIIDEALSVGDASFAAKATKRILKICAEGKIVILVSHSMQSIRDICNRCIYLKDGKIVMDDTPESVTNAYINEVRSQDEAELLERFASHVGNWTLAMGYEIDNPIILTGDAQLQAVRVEAAQKLTIRLGAKLPIDEVDAICRICILRLDDLVIFQQDFVAIDYFGSDGDYSLELEFYPLPLAPAIYRIDAEVRKNVMEDALVYAKSSSIFEVYSLSSPAGGKPMLYYPVTLEANLV